jgi:hypothetical protein
MDTRSQAATGPAVDPNVRALTASNATNIEALTTSIQDLVTQLLSGGGSIAAATSFIKGAIEASANSNAAAIGTLTASTADAASSAKVTADDAVARAKPAVKYALHPGNHDANNALDYSTKHGVGLYLAATAALSGVAWDHTLGNTLGLSNMLGLRASKSGWLTGAGDILITIKDDAGIDRKLQ